MSYSGKYPVDTMAVSNPERKRAVSGNRGFTLIEILVVVVIVGILATIAIAIFPLYRDAARSARAASEIHTIANAVSGYYADRGAYPPSLNEVGYGALNDPWGISYQYSQTPGARTFASLDINSDYDLWSKGANSLSDPSIVTSEDDIIRGRDGGFVGLAKNY